MSIQLESGIEKLREQLDYQVDTFFSSCVRCGICAESCLFYTETGDPRYTPIYKTQPLQKLWKQEYTFWGKLGKALGFSQTLTEQDFTDWEQLVYDGCTMCGRCSLVCPLGIDIASLIQKVKSALAAAGCSPQDLVLATQRAVEIGSPMGVQLPALQAQIRHIEKESGLTIPMDVEEADYMAILSSMEVIEFPEYLESIARIFLQAGVSWTLCSEAFEATNSGLQIGDDAIAGKLVARVVAGAEKLKVKYVISPECGHAYAAIRWNGPNYIGRPYPFKVIHILELLEELKQSGRLKTRNRDDTRLTFHDPCQIVRRGGVEAQPHELLRSVAGNFAEMSEHGHMNWCCGGGGGVSTIDRAAELRTQVFNRKKSQLDEIKVEKIVTACANCRMMLEDGLEQNDMDIQVVGLTEEIAQYLVEDH